MFKDMKIGFRLGLGFASVIILMLGCGLFAIDKLSQTNGVIQVIVSDRWPKAVIANEMVHNINRPLSKVKFYPIKSNEQLPLLKEV